MKRNERSIYSVYIKIDLCPLQSIPSLYNKILVYTLERPNHLQTYGITERIFIPDKKICQPSNCYYDSQIFIVFSFPEYNTT